MVHPPANHKEKTLFLRSKKNIIEKQNSWLKKFPVPIGIMNYKKETSRPLFLFYILPSL